jgi:hypothetical protein
MTPQFLCNYQKNSLDLWECQNPGCRDVFKRLAGVSYPDVPPVRECPAAPEIIIAATEAGGRLGLLDTAGHLAEDAMHYARSLAQWAWAGFPVRSTEETAIRYKICMGCDEFDGGKCTICGCPVKKKRGMLIKNKAALKTEQCPHEDVSRWPLD